MNEKLLTGAVVAGSLALAVAAGAVIEGFAERDEKPQAREEKPKKDKRPIIEASVRVKALPTGAEQAASKPGRLADGGSVVWTITGAHERVRIAPPCRIPNCWLSDGGWDDGAVVDCRATGVRGLADGGPRWAGCNVMLAAEAVGAGCVPVACSVWSGDEPSEVLR